MTFFLRVGYSVGYENPVVKKEIIMPAQKRNKTDYAGVYFIWGTHRVTSKPEKIFYITYRKDGRQISEKVGRQSEDMTPARASRKRALRMTGKEPSNNDKREAEKAIREAENSRWTVSKLWDKYCDTFPDNKALRNEKNKFNRYLRNGIGKMEPNELSPLDIDRLRINLKKEGKLTTSARILEILRRTLNFGIKRGLTPAISFKIEIPRLNNQTTEDLTPDQFRKLLDILNTHEDQVAANIMRLALCTGMRKSELFRLQWDDIDFQRGFIIIRDPKGGQDQKIPLNETAREILRNVHKDNESIYVFPGRKNGEHITDCKGCSSIAKKAELPKGFRPVHGLRHVYASALASSGEVDLYTLQKLLTHKSPVMTQRYAHLRDEALKKAAGVADNIMTSAINNRNAEKEEVIYGSK